jgi:hypothetical protein
MNRDPDGYFTPQHIADMVREAMGGVIDLDPASCEAANERIKAVKFYTKEQNGLIQPWHGNVFLAPPHSAGVDKFIDKALSEWHMGGIGQMIVMLQGRINQALAKVATRIRIYPKLIRCVAEDGSAVEASMTFYYFGNEPERFDSALRASLTEVGDELIS